MIRTIDTHGLLLSTRDVVKQFCEYYGRDDKFNEILFDFNGRLVRKLLDEYRSGCVTMQINVLGYQDVFVSWACCGMLFPILRSYYGNFTSVEIANFKLLLDSPDLIRTNELFL